MLPRPEIIHNCLHYLQAEPAAVLNGTTILICKSHIIVSKKAEALWL